MEIYCVSEFLRLKRLSFIYLSIYTYIELLGDSKNKLRDLVLLPSFLIYDYFLVYKRSNICTNYEYNINTYLLHEIAREYYTKIIFSFLNLFNICAFFIIMICSQSIFFHTSVIPVLGTGRKI